MPQPAPDQERTELEVLLASKGPAAVLDAILGSTPSGAVIVRAPDGKILRFSDYAARMLGRSRQEIEGRHVTTDEVDLLPTYHPSGRPLLPSERPLTRALSGEAVTGFEYLVEAADGERIACVCNAAPIRNSRGAVIGAINSIADLRPYKALEQGLRDEAARREALYRELAHQVKNHLQIISSLIALETRNQAVTTADLADTVKGKLQTLAAVYEHMTRAEAGSRVGAQAFIEQVCRPHASATVQVEAAVAPPDLTVACEQAGPVGLLINEAVGDSLKHAFPDRGGHIWVSLRRLQPGRLRLEIADDGVAASSRPEARASGGLDLTRLFAKQLHGEIALGERPEGGALVSVELPEAPA